MTRQAVTRGAKLVVWSEESLGGEFAPADPKDETRRLARQLETALVVGYSDDTRPKPFNCAAYIAPNGDVLSPAHHKIHLYLAEHQTNQSGSKATVVETPQGRVGLEICLHSCRDGLPTFFPDMLLPQRCPPERQSPRPPSCFPPSGR